MWKSNPTKGVAIEFLWQKQDRLNIGFDSESVEMLMWSVCWGKLVGTSRDPVSEWTPTYQPTYQPPNQPSCSSVAPWPTTATTTIQCPKTALAVCPCIYTFPHLLKGRLYGGNRQIVGKVQPSNMPPTPLNACYSQTTLASPDMIGWPHKMLSDTSFSFLRPFSSPWQLQ